MSVKKALDLFFKKFEKGELKSGSRTLLDLSKEQILIYGAGNVGQRLQMILSRNHLDVVGFLDKNKNNDALSSPTPVFHPESESVSKYKQSACIIIAGLFNAQTREAISTYLSALGFLHVYQLYEIDFARYVRFHCYENTIGGYCRRVDLLAEELPKIFQAFDLFYAERDRQCYLNFLKAHLTMDFLQLPAPDDAELQYLAPDIHYPKNYSNFIDCGGYDGDTVRNILQHDYKIENLLIFEPQELLYQKIVAFLNESRQLFKSAFALPCAVFSETKPLFFQALEKEASTGRLDASASSVVQCVKLDDVLYGFKPTFIKMDIEGAELAALQGAQKIIRRYQPQLAICVYHSLSHVWDIPLLLADMVDGYNFFLRCYNNMTMETVLYAFPKA